MKKKTEKKTSKKNYQKTEKKVKKGNGFKADLFSLKGEKVGVLALPEEIFFRNPNEKLVAQAVRVFLSNQRKSRAKAKKRGEVRGSTRKIWAQKGTGRARHGDRYAPIFVGGGSAHGPTGRENWHLKFPKKMKQRAFFSILGDRGKEKMIVAVADLEKITAKTKIAAHLLAAIIKEQKKRKVKKTLLVINNEKTDKIVRAFRNLAGVEMRSFDNLNTYLILNSDLLVFQQKAFEAFVSFRKKKEKKQL